VGHKKKKTLKIRDLLTYKRQPSEKKNKTGRLVARKPGETGEHCCRGCWNSESEDEEKAHEEKKEPRAMKTGEDGKFALRKQGNSRKKKK